MSSVSGTGRREPPELEAALLAPLSRAFYDRSAEEVAPALLGCFIVREIEGRRLTARIVETEAYLGPRDRASHAWGGRRTARNTSLYLPPGHAYVYLIYGLHHCFNAVTGGEEAGGAVLVRAVEPVEGFAAMEARRSLGRPPRPGDLGGGPGKLCQALAVDRELDGAPLAGPPLWIGIGEPVSRSAIATGPRVGIDYAGDATSWPLRFAIAGHRHVSRPRLLS